MYGTDVGERDKGIINLGYGTKSQKCNGAFTLGLGLQKQFTRMCAIQAGVDWVRSKAKSCNDNIGTKAKAGSGFIAHICAVLTPKSHI
jgi:hypothetical protein